MSLPTRTHKGLVCEGHTKIVRTGTLRVKKSKVRTYAGETESGKKGHTCLSLQDRTKGWYAGEKHTKI